jgi:hypothetical protein
MRQHLTSSVHINIAVTWDITPRNLVLEERRHLPPSSSLLHWWLSRRCLWNVGTHLPDYTASHPRSIIIFLAIVVRHSNLIQIFCFHLHDTKRSKVQSLGDIAPPFCNSTINAYDLSDSRPGRFNPRQASRCPVNRRQSAIQNRIWRKISLASSGNRTAILSSSPQSSHCTDWVIPSPHALQFVEKFSRLTATCNSN